MTQEDLFKVMDALQLSVDDVLQYLKKMCKTTPLKLAFKSRNGKTYCTNHPEERKDSDIFLGIVIETTIFSPAEFDIRSLKKKNGTSFKFHEGFLAEEIYSCDIFDWAMHFGCYPAREEQMELLYKFRFEYDETQKILDYHHIAARPLEAKALCSQKYNGAYTSCDIYDLKEGALSRNHRLSSVVGNPAAQIKPYAWCPLIL